MEKVILQVWKMALAAFESGKRPESFFYIEENESGEDRFSGPYGSTQVHGVFTEEARARGMFKRLRHENLSRHEKRRQKDPNSFSVEHSGPKDGDFGTSSFYLKKVELK